MAMEPLPQQERGQPLVDRSGALTPAGWAELERLRDYIRRMQADFEARIAALEAL